MGIPVCTLKLRVVVLGILARGSVRGHVEMPGDYREVYKRSQGMPRTCPVGFTSRRSGMLSGHLGNGTKRYGILRYGYRTVLGILVLAGGESVSI